jgi:aminomethyltransferase
MANPANLRTALYDWHVSQRARMVPFAGWNMPVQYSGIIEEHKAVRGAVGMFDVSHMGRLNLSGTHAEALIEQVFTNSVATMVEGQVRYGLVCQENGGILDDVLVYKWAKSFSMVVNASNRDKIVAWLNQHAKGRSVQLQDETLETALIAVQGPKAVQVLNSSMFTDDISKLKYYFAQSSQYKNTPCVVSRTGYTGEDGFEVKLPNALVVSFCDELLTRGVLPCGLGSRDTLRLEAAMPLYGHELNEQLDPISAGLGWAVKLDKGDFIGRNALKNHADGLPMRVGLILDGKRAAREGSPVHAGGQQVGTVCSGSYVPHLEKSIAMAYVPRTSATPGTALEVDLRGSRIPATVVRLPFYKRAKST